MRRASEGILDELADILTPAGIDEAVAEAPVPHVSDDRRSVKSNDRVVLITEDDMTFASILLDIARQNGMKGILAQDGETAVEMARRYGPTTIVLDIQMPGMDGWDVLDELKRDPRTRHIPVLIVSGADPRMGMAMARSPMSRSRPRPRRLALRSRRSTPFWSGRPSSFC